MDSKIIFIRHGETVESLSNILLGQQDGNLSERGKKMSKEWAQNIKSYGFERIISSDLGRAKSTAQIIANELNIPNASYTEALRERSSGIFEGRSADDVNWLEYEKVNLADRKHQDGESFKEVENRLCSFVDEMLKFEKNTLVVSHSVVMRMIVKIVNGISLEEALGMDLEGKFLLLEDGEIKILS